MQSVNAFWTLVSNASTAPPHLLPHTPCGHGAGPQSRRQPHLPPRKIGQRQGCWVYAAGATFGRPGLHSRRQLGAQFQARPLQFQPSPSDTTPTPSLSLPFVLHEAQLKEPPPTQCLLQLQPDHQHKRQQRQLQKLQQWQKHNLKRNRQLQLAGPSAAFGPCPRSDTAHGGPGAAAADRVTRGGNDTSLALPFVVRNMFSWSEAAQLLDAAGGPEGRPPPQLQLQLLLQSRLFRIEDRAAVTSLADRVWVAREGSWSDADATVAGSGGGGGGMELERSGARSGGAAYPDASASGAAPLGGGTDPWDEAQWPFSDEGGGFRLEGSGAWSGSNAAAARDAAEDARWRADWALEWEVQLQKHARWLMEPPPPPPPPQYNAGGAPDSGFTSEATAAAARTAAAVMLPGHAVAAATAATAAGAAARPEGPSGLTRLSPIPPMRSLGTQPALPTTPPPAHNPKRQRKKKMQQNQSPPPPNHQQHHPQQQQQPAADQRAVAGQRSSLPSGLASDVRRGMGDQVDEALAAEVLARIVYDAAVVQPEAWEDDQIATLLRRAAKIVYRYPGLLSQRPSSQEQSRTPSSSAPRPSYRRNSAVELPPSQPLAGGWRLHTSMEPPSLHAGGLHVGADARPSASPYLRVRLQQLLLRVDGMLQPPPLPLQQQRQQPRLGSVGGGRSLNLSRPSATDEAVGSISTAPVAAVAAAAASQSRPEVEAGARALARQPPRLSAAAAAGAAWAAAAMQLSLSPEGDVRRRLLVEFRPQGPRRGQRREQADGRPPRRPPPLLLSSESPEGQAQVHSGLPRQWTRLTHGRWDQPLPPRGIEERPRQPRLQLQLRTRAAAAGSSPGSLTPGDVADVLWAFAVLGWQMSRPELDRALRAVSESRPRRLALRTALRRRLPLSRVGPGAAASPNPGASAESDHRKVLLTAPAAAEAVVMQQPGMPAGRNGGDGGMTTGDGSGCGRGAGHVVLGLGALRPSQVTGVAWAAVALSDAAGLEGVTAVWAAQLFAATQARLSRLSASQLVDLLWSVGRGRRTPTGPWRRALAAALLAAAPRLVPWQAARAAAALAKLRIPIPYTLAAALLIALHGRLTEAQPSDVAAMVWALSYISYPYTAQFVHKHRRLLLDFALYTQPALPSLEPSQLVQLADGFARLRQLPGVEWMRLHREACIRLKSRFSEPNRRKIRQAYAVMLDL